MISAATVVIPGLAGPVVLVTGSRTLGPSYHRLVWGCLDELGPGLVVTGGCLTGADEIARRWAADRQVPHLAFPARWNTRGAAAGPERNLQMVAAVPDDAVVLSFPRGESRGSRHCLRLARDRGLKTLVHEVPR